MCGAYLIHNFELIPPSRDIDEPTAIFIFLTEQHIGQDNGPSLLHGFRVVVRKQKIIMNDDSSGFIK